jgi:glutamate:GABA antiporter
MTDADLLHHSEPNTPVTSPDQPAPELPRSLGLRDLVLLNVVAVLSLRWLSTSAATGTSALTLWVLAGLLFFVPMGLAVSELATRYPEEGGIYAWTKRAFGEGHGFLAGWCYWINNVMYPPSLLIATAAMATYAFGKGSSGLGSEWWYVISVTLGALWLVVGLNIVGLGTGKWLQNIGAVGSYVPGLILVALGAVAVATRPPANDFSLAALVPDMSNLSELNLWASVAFAFAGLELAAVYAGETRDPARTLPRAVLIAAPLIAGVYILGTFAVLYLVPAHDVNIVSGLLQAIQAGGVAGWLVPIAAMSVVVGSLGAVGAWLSGPARIAFMIGLDRYFPEGFGRIHPRFGTPYVAILVQAGIATAFLFVAVLGRGTTVEKAYLVILDTMLLLYFIPFIYLFLSYLKFTRREPSPRARGAKPWLVAVPGLSLTVLAMAVAMVPPADTNPWIFELKVVGGTLWFLLVGGWLYWRKRRPDLYAKR